MSDRDDGNTRTLGLKFRVASPTLRERTEWKFGSKIFNILTLGIVHQGVAFPLLWWMLDKKGNSHTQERVDLLRSIQ